MNQMEKLPPVLQKRYKEKHLALQLLALDQDRLSKKLLKRILSNSPMEMVIPIVENLILKSLLTKEQLRSHLAH